ncbi:MAG TPA: OsmC family protein [Microbacterium sp.]|nr:OsmC family protein [Microbacterium sp.]
MTITSRDELRAAQAPLKDRYRQDPGAAITPVRAEAEFSDPGVTATVASWNNSTVRTGLHTATGGDGSDACSADLLMQALVACAGVTLRSVATAMALDVRSATLVADAVFDARGTLGLDRSVDVGVQRVRVLATVDTDAGDDDLARLAASTERYCVVGQSLRSPPAIVIRRADAAGGDTARPETATESPRS